MNLKEIKSLIDMINTSDINEATIEEGDFKITLKKSSATPLPDASLQPTVQTTAPAVPTPPQAGSFQHDAEPATSPNNGLVEIRSPIVGTFYRSPSPDTDPFINVSDHFESGQVLCIIEAMKLMNEIESDFSGTVVDILVENGQPIEYDQVLFLVKPSNQ